MDKNISRLHCVPFDVSGSILDSGSGRHASLMTSSRNGINGGMGHAGEDATLQLREGNLAGQKVNYLDSGYSEEDAGQEMTSCLMKTASGSIYIPGSE